MNITITRIALLILLPALMCSACKSLNKAQKGVLIGAGAGGAAGAGVGKVAGNTALGAIIGATVGGVTGGLIGRNMDKQAQELDKIPGAQVKRVGEGINVTFDSGVLFAVDQSDLTETSRQKLRDLTAVLNKYPDTYILIEGHTDNSGPSDHNMDLSERRAKSVSDFLAQQSVNANRLKTKWYGETQPKYANDSEANKAQNRRVEFAIYANEKMINETKSASAAK